MALPFTPQNVAFWNYGMQTGAAIDDRAYEALLRRLAQNRADQAVAEDARRFNAQQQFAYWQPQFQYGAQSALQADRLGAEAARQDQLVGQRYDLADFEAANQRQREQFAAQVQAERDQRQAELQAQAAEQTFGHQRALQGDRFGQQLDLSGLEHQQRLESMGVQHGFGMETQAVALGAQQAAQERAAEIEAQRAQERERFEAGKAMFAAEVQAKQEGRLFDRQTFLADYQAQKAFEGQMAEGLRTGKLRYTPGQQQKMSQWQDQLARVQDDPTLTDDQRRLAVSQLQQKIRGIVPVSVPPDQQPVPLDEQLRQKFGPVYENIKHLPFFINKDGDPQLPRGYVDPGPSQQKAETDRLNAIQKADSDWLKQREKELTDATTRKRAFEDKVRDYYRIEVETWIKAHPEDVELSDEVRYKMHQAAQRMARMETEEPGARWQQGDSQEPPPASAAFDLGTARPGTVVVGPDGRRWVKR